MKKIIEIIKIKFLKNKQTENITINKIHYAKL
jgi:hypothetical protein